MRSWLVRQLRRHRVPVLIGLDSIAWILAIYMATAFRLQTWHTVAEFRIAESGIQVPLWGVLIVGTIAAALHCLFAWAVRLHQGRSSTGSFEEVFVLASIMFTVGVSITLANALLPLPLIPRAAPLVAACFALISVAWPRALWRLVVIEARPNRFGVITTPVLIVGAGEAARQLIASMQRDQQQTWHPVGMVDDDTRKRHFRHRGVAVVGTIDKLGSAATKYDATSVVIAIPSANSDTMVRINDLARKANLDVKVLPSVGDLMGGVDHTEMRDISPADLLGRHQIETDINSIAGYLKGKRVLVTGAGGSIGSELCRQIDIFEPAELMMLDRDESALHSLVLSLHGRADLESPDVILANIRDTERLQEIFELRRPEVVFHAAALKHLNMLESQASEAVKTNIQGTLNVLVAAQASGVARFVNISTDKAADPVNVLGYSKRIAEGLTRHFATTFGGVYLSVRFGNVLGTRGSVLKTFAAQIKAGGPLTVTDPEVTRYFMTVHEAVQLVIQAAAIGTGGQALVLDMGKPVKIIDVARQLIDQSRKPIKIVITGLKHGEKLHEVLLGTGEIDVRPIHPLVSHVSVPPISPEDVLALPRGRDNEANVQAMIDLTSTMQFGARQEASR